MAAFHAGAHPGTAYSGTPYPDTAYPNTAYPDTAYPSTAYSSTANPTSPTCPTCPTSSTSSTLNGQPGAGPCFFSSICQLHSTASFLSSVWLCQHCQVRNSHPSTCDATNHAAFSTAGRCNDILCDVRIRFGTRYNIPKYKYC